MFGVDPISVLPFSTIGTVVIEGFILLCSPYMNVGQSQGHLRTSVCSGYVNSASANGYTRRSSVIGSIESPLISATVEPLPCDD